MIASISCSISEAIASRAVWSVESVLPWTSRSRARRDVLRDVVERRPRSSSAQPCASCTLRWYCWVPRELAAQPIAWEAWNGSSDGRLISLPEAAFFCGCVSLAATELRSASTLRWTIEVVMRVLIRDPTLPVRLIRTSSISSSVLIARADAW